MKAAPPSLLLPKRQHGSTCFPPSVSVVVLHLKFKARNGQGDSTDKDLGERQWEEERSKEDPLKPDGQRQVIGLWGSGAQW